MEYECLKVQWLDRVRLSIEQSNYWTLFLLRTSTTMSFNHFMEHVNCISAKNVYTQNKSIDSSQIITIINNTKSYHQSNFNWNLISHRQNTATFFDDCSPQCNFCDGPRNGQHQRSAAVNSVQKVMENGSWGRTPLEVRKRLSWLVRFD